MIVKEVLFDSAEYKLLLKLREEELRRPLGRTLIAADTFQEEEQYHFGVFEGDQAVACMVLRPIDVEQVKMRQVCTSNEWQGKGLGMQLLKFAEHWAQEKNYSKITCHARESATPFYLKNGYSIQGEVFEEVGIPHYRMFKDILAS